MTTALTTANDAAIAAAQASVAVGADVAVPQRPPVAGDTPAVAIGSDAFVIDAPAAALDSASHQTPLAAQSVGHLGTAAATQTAQLGVASPQATAAGTAPTGAGSIGGALLALVLVVGLIVLLGWLAKRLPGVGGGTANPALRVLGSLSLGPRERVVVIAVGDTQLLVGTGATGTRVLHTLDTPLPTPVDTPSPAFAQVLAQHFGKKRP
ncbi:flagellar biosynthetic protein FliO [Luteimonas sp. RIT-PG2_3]